MPSGEFEPRALLRVLMRHELDFVLIGGLAASITGSAYATDDTDIAYARDRPNLERLAAALRELGASLRGAPADIPFLLDADTLEQGLNFTFDTQFGPFDILGEPAGAPRYAELKEASQVVEAFDASLNVASIDHLIAMKEAAGRTKDKLVASELRVISDRMRAPEP